MPDGKKTKEELIKEIQDLRQEVQNLRNLVEDIKKAVTGKTNKDNKKTAL